MAFSLSLVTAARDPGPGPPARITVTSPDSDGPYPHRITVTSPDLDGPDPHRAPDIGVTYHVPYSPPLWAVYRSIATIGTLLFHPPLW